MKIMGKKKFSRAISISLALALNLGAVGALSLVSLGITAIVPAMAAPINVTANGWTLTVPDLNFSSSYWKFSLVPNSTNSFDPYDQIKFELKDAKGKLIGSDFDFIASTKVASTELEIYVNRSSFSAIDTVNPFVATATITRDSGSKQSSVLLTFKVPTTSIPKKPVSFSEYIKFETDIAKQELPFPLKDCLKYEFKYSILDPYDELSEVNFELRDSNNEEVKSDYATSSNSGIQKSDFDICAYDIKEAVGPFTFVTKLVFDDETGKSDLISTIKAPSNNFPKRPVTFTDYLTLKTDFSTTEIPYPKSCSSFEFQYLLNDPYGNISTTDFVLLDVTGKEIASDSNYLNDSPTQSSSLSICDYTLAKSAAPFTLRASINFSSSTGKLALQQIIPVKIENPVVKHLTALNAQGVVCVKGSTYTVLKSGKCASGYKIVNFSEPTDLQWNTLTRSPAQMKGKNFVIFACVAQFDANTGGSKFRAYAATTPQASSWLSGVNSLFTGNAKSLLKLKEDDAFIAKVNVVGATSYSTIGNKTTVPSFAVRDFVKIGTC